MPKKPQKRARTTAKRISRAQHDRAPLMGVRVPRPLYEGLQAAAKAEHRTLADWMRLNLPRLLVPRIDELADKWFQEVNKNVLHIPVTGEPTEPKQ